MTPRNSTLLPVRITTARRPDHVRLSSLVRSRSTQFIVHANSQVDHGPPKRGAQSLPRRRFRRALRAFICTFCMRVCIYVYVCMCADMIYLYICMCVCICTSMRLYTCVCVCVCVCIFVHRLWVLVSVLQRVDGVMLAHVFSCAYACVYICV